MAATSDEEFQHLELLATPLLQPFCYHWSLLARSHALYKLSFDEKTIIHEACDRRSTKSRINPFREPCNRYAIVRRHESTSEEELRRITSVEIYRLGRYGSLSQVFGLSSILLRRNASTLLYIRHERTSSQSRIVATNRNAPHGLMST